MRKEIALLGALAACDLPTPPKEMKKINFELVDSEKKLGNTEPEDVTKPDEVEVNCDQAHAPFEIKTHFGDSQVINGIAYDTNRYVLCTLDPETGNLRLDITEEVTCEDGAGHDVTVGQKYGDTNMDGKVDDQYQFMHPSYSVTPTKTNNFTSVGTLVGSGKFFFPRDEKTEIADMPVARRWTVGEHPKNDTLEPLCANVIQGNYPIQNLSW